MIPKIGKKLRTASLKSKFTGSYKNKMQMRFFKFFEAVLLIL